MGSARTRGPGRWSKWSSARPETRGGRCRKVREGKGKKQERIVEKVAGDECVFVPGELADKVGSDAVLDGASRKDGHGVAKPDRVIHRNIFLRGHY
jgi:hypothetical protein